MLFEFRRVFRHAQFIAGKCLVFERFKDLEATEEDHELMEIPRHALHAIAIKIKYQGEDRIFRAPLPTDLLAWLESKNFPTDFLDKAIAEQIEDYFSAK